jgi:hypothetical protein
VRSHAKASTAGPIHRRVAGLSRLAAAPLAIAAALLALAPAAFAGPSRSYTSSFGSFESSNPQALAVDQSTGDIYAVETGTGSVKRFDAAGNPKNFTAGTDVGTNSLAGIAWGAFVGEGEVAVDNSGGPADGAVYVTDVASSSVKVYKTDGTSLGTLTGTGTAAGSFASACGVAVDQATGDLYVADPNANRIWRYSPSGATVAEGDYSGGIETSFGPCQLAADSGNVYATPLGIAGGNLTRFRSESFATGAPPAPTGTVIDATSRAVSVNPLNGDVYADRGKEIAVYQSGAHAGDSPYYTFGSEADFGTTSPGVAVKANGPAYVADRHNAGGKQIDVYGAESFGFPLTVNKTGPGTGTVTSSPAGINCGSTCQAPFSGSVTLTAIPDAGSGFKSWTGCNSTAGNQCTVSVAAARSITATFTAKPAISGTAASSIGSASATLTAQVNPGGEPTTYHFEYTDDADFQANGFANAIRKPVPDAAAVGVTAVPVSTTVTDLSPATVYHFRLVAINPVGATEGTEVAFHTYASSSGFDPCPNDGFRTGAGGGLPDCRAYEQATPVEKNGGDATGVAARTVGVSPAGDAVSFNVLNGLPGASGTQVLPTYVAHRGATDWYTKGLQPAASLSDRGQLQDFTPDLRYGFSYGRKYPIDALSWSFLGADTVSGESFVVYPEPPVDSSGNTRLLGVSDDGSKVFFVNAPSLEYANPQLTPDTAPGAANVYAWDRATGALSLAGKTPVEPDAECGAGGPACVTPASGSQISGFVQYRHVVSGSGDQVVFNAGSEDQLYARTDPAGPDPSTVQVSASQRTDCANHDPCSGEPEPDPVGKAPAGFQYATPSGSKVLFTSSEELTDDANTGPPFLPSYIGRADVADGGNPDSGFIPLQKATGLEVNGNFLYWVEPEANRIGRADISDADCSPNPAPCHVNPDFITGADNPKRVAFYEGRIYWTNAAGTQEGEGSIGRADLPANPGDSAENVNQNYIDTTVQLDFVEGGVHRTNTAFYPYGIAFDSIGHLWWGALSRGSSFFKQPALIRADADGGNPTIWGKYLNCPSCPGEVPSTQSWSPTDIEIDGSDIYIVNHNVDLGGQFDNFSSVAKLSMTDEFARQNITSTGPSPEGETDNVAIDASHVYWAERVADTIGRASRDGSDVNHSFLTGVDSAEGVAVDGSHLYYSSLVDASANPGNDLYAWDRSSHELTDLAPDSTDENGAEVMGVLGASDDGSHVYFVANADLAGAGPASAGDCQYQEGNSGAGQCNLYLWHAGDPIRFIARLAGATASGDGANWTTESNVLRYFNGFRTSRVSADGHSVLFSSVRRLTAYDNQGEVEVYRYNTADGLACVSCMPTGAPAVYDTRLQSIIPSSLSPGTEAEPVGNEMSADGNRVFFESYEKLVAADTNGEAGCPVAPGFANEGPRTCRDVYEWEAPGTGSCTEASSAYSSQDGGCLYLISTGRGSEPAYLAGASATGDDVFFFTRESLVPQDTDQLVDVYDARVGGGLASQHASAPPGCAGEACRGAGSAAAGAQGAGSAAFSGPGNESQVQAKNCNPAAKRAQKLARASKRLRGRANRAVSPAAAKRLLRQSAALAKRADRMSRSAKRCRSANRRVAR